MWSDASERYNTEITAIFTAESKLKLQLEVETALAKVQTKIGLVSEEEYSAINKAQGSVKLERVHEIENDIHHDLMAMVKAFSEQAGEAGGKIHLGATSNDIQDTVLALQMVKAKEMMLDRLDELSEVIFKLVVKYKNTSCIGRTHGQFAVPTTVGFKFANFLYELQLAKTMLKNSQVNLSKFSGAIGNYASTMRMDIEKLLFKELKLEPTVISTQVTPRVIHAQLMNSLAICAGVIERISKEIRNLQRSEIKEWFEPFSAHQVGSSAMPHKRNPHKSERISGLSRIIRSNVQVALENISLEHERDISHSSVERIIIPESFNLLYYITMQMTSILSKIEINEANIQRNLERASAAKSEQILIKLVPFVGRQEGHEMIRKHVNDEDFRNAILSDPEILKHISKDELNKIFDETNVGLADEKCNQVIDVYEKEWKNYRI